MPENTLLSIPTTDLPALNPLMDFYDPSDAIGPPINVLASLISSPAEVPSGVNPSVGLINNARALPPANALNPPAGLINNQPARLK